MWRDRTRQLQVSHLKALEWFESHSGQIITWKEIKEHFEKTGSRLVNQAKGIYKPAGIDYALSVRQTLTGPYDDLEVQRRSNGSWLFPYFQENSDPALRDREATNRGLMKCMSDQVPVGVLIQRTPKPGVTYEVLGLATVIDWRDGYFFLQGIGHARTRLLAEDRSEAAKDRARVELIASRATDFGHAQSEDRREKVIAEIVRRKGQPKFRRELLEAYHGRCAISGCDATEALEAAHITPYLGEDTNHVQNGLLLRADLHSLFDLGLLSVDPGTLRVRLAQSLIGTSYAEFEGRQVRATDQTQSQPSVEALRRHWEWCGFTAETEATGAREE